MDPADFQHLCALVDKQGSTLNSHQQEMASVTQHLQALSNSVSHLSAQLQQLQAADSSVETSATIASPVHPMPSPGAEPRLPPPSRYSGEPGLCRSFLSQCSLIFELQPSSFSSERSCVAYIITLLDGRAREWGTSMWEANSPVCTSLMSFTQEMRKVFDRSVSGREAARVLLQARQGRRSVSDYAIDFRTLAASCSWNVDAQFDAFLNGLSESIKDELATRELPATLDLLIDLAIRIDTRLTQRQKERLARCPQSSSCRSPATESSPSPADPEPMQLDRTRLSPAERQRRIATGSCLYCGKPGHYVATCPLKANARQ